ncbi:MAG: hypothetical protein EXR71_09660 [Myxococcales bacterium]|nr:hypothetical protein [Myxococcales bacterium]
MLLFIAQTLAATVLLPPPEVVLTVGDGLTLSRRGDEAEGEDPPSPNYGGQSAQDSWSLEMERRRDRRIDLAAADAIIADHAPLIAACAVAAGAPVGAGASATVTFAPTTSVLSAAVKGGGNLALAECVRSTLHKRQVGGLLHPVAYPRGAMPTVDPTWSFSLVGAPAAVPGPMDIEVSLGGVRFGQTGAMIAENSAPRHNGRLAIYSRGTDDNVRYMGIPCSLGWLADDDDVVMGVRLRVSGDTAALLLRDRLKARFGAGRYDASMKGWYWRGARFVYVLQHVPDSENEELVIFDIEPALRSGAAKFIPGDVPASQVNASTRLPKILKNP